MTRAIPSFAAALFAAFLCGCGLFGGGDEITAPDSTAQGFRFLEKGKYSYAMGAFNDALDLDPAYAPARYGLGRVFIETGYIEGAEEQFRRAVVLDSTYGDAYLGLGRLYYKLDEHEKAEENILKAKSLGAMESAHALYLLGIYSERRGSYWDAESNFRKSLRLEPENTEARLALVDLLRDRGSYDEALAELERADFPRGYDDDIRLRFADCRLHLGQDLEAERLYRELINRNPHWYEPRWGLAILALRRGDQEEAAEQLEEYARLVPEGEGKIFIGLAEDLYAPDSRFTFADRCREIQEETGEEFEERLDQLIEAAEGETG